jgi:hypothetical protein
MLARRTALALVAASLALGACHRKVEPYDPNEQVEQPDLSKIFPEGASRAMAQAPAELPPSPEQLMGGAPAVAGITAPENVGPPLRGTVRLAAGADAPASATLFVIARVGEAGPPTAVLRVPAPSFPFAFVLGPEHRMIAEMPWQGPLIVSARIDLDGNAMTREGGPEGRSAQPASPGDAGIEIVLEPAS